MSFVDIENLKGDVAPSRPLNGACHGRIWLCLENEARLSGTEMPRFNIGEATN